LFTNAVWSRDAVKGWSGQYCDRNDSATLSTAVASQSNRVRH